MKRSNQPSRGEISKSITDKIIDKVHSILNQMGGLINPWLWGALLMVILIGQSWTVKIFVVLALGISVYFKWFYKPEKNTQTEN